MRTLSRFLPLAALSVATACGDTAPGSPAPTGGEATPGGSLVIASPAEPDLLIPGFTVTLPGRMATDMMFDRLAEIGDGLNTVGDEGFTPRLAQQWRWAPDSLSIAFALDPRARWHDGRPVRAADVAFTFALHKDPSAASPIAIYLTNIDSVTARDSLTAVVWYRRRNAEQFFDAAYHAPIIPEHVYGTERAGIRTSPLARTPVGSGRFRFSRWDAGSRLELLSDTTNYRGRALLDRVVWTYTPDPTSALNRLTAGEADFYETVPPDQAERIEQMVTVRVFPYANLQFSFMAMNLRERKRGPGAHPVFGDVRVRRALSMAVDRDGMLRNVFGSYGRRSYGPFPKSLGVADTTLALPPFDTTAAKALLDSAGWVPGPDGIRRKGGQPLRFSLLVPASSRPRASYAVLLQEQFRRVGVDVSIESTDFPTFMARQDARDFDAALAAFSTDPSAAGARQQFGSAATSEGGTNYMMYTSPVFDAHVDSALVAHDRATVHRHMQAAYGRMVGDAPGIWLYDVLSLGGLHARIRTAPMRADEYWAHIADWHIPERERLPRDRVGLGTLASH